MKTRSSRYVEDRTFVHADCYRGKIRRNAHYAQQTGGRDCRYTGGIADIVGIADIEQGLQIHCRDLVNANASYVELPNEGGY